jgi:hypothetical protein
MLARLAGNQHIPEENAAHACISNENDEEKNEEVEKVTGCFLDGARHETHALLHGHSFVSTYISLRHFHFSLQAGEMYSSKVSTLMAGADMKWGPKANTITVAVERMNSGDGTKAPW